MQVSDLVSLGELARIFIGAVVLAVVPGGRRAPKPPPRAPIMSARSVFTRSSQRWSSVSTKR